MTLIPIIMVGHQHNTLNIYHMQSTFEMIWIKHLIVEYDCVKIIFLEWCFIHYFLVKIF